MKRKIISASSLCFCSCFDVLANVRSDDVLPSIIPASKDVGIFGVDCVPLRLEPDRCCFFYDIEKGPVARV